MSKPPDEQDQSPAKIPPSKPLPPNFSTSTGLEPQVIQKVLHIAEREAEARIQEIDLEKQVRADAHEYAKLALTAQAEDIKDDRSHRRSERRDKMYFSAVVVIVLSAFLIVLIYLGQVELAKQIASYIGVSIASIYGGYSYGLRKTKEKKDEE